MKLNEILNIYLQMDIQCAKFHGCLVAEIQNPGFVTFCVSGYVCNRREDLNNYRADCYVALGRRWDLDSWPSTDGFYQGRCR